MNSKSPGQFAFRLAFVVGAIICAPRETAAHEIGKTQVTGTFDSADAYRVEVVVDPDVLLTKLEVFGGTPVSRGLDRTERNKRIDALRAVFLRNASIWFDGVRDQPQFEFVPASSLNDLAQTPSVVRLTGTIPPAAHDVAFAYGLAMGSYALNVRIGASPVETLWINDTERSPAVSLVAPPLPLTRFQVARQYFALGYTHILPKGLDHILFVVGIFLLSARWRSILLQVSTFTLAHSITLGLTMYGVVSLPAKVVEPMIALSIAYVAMENLFTSELKPWRVALVFSFGLLHGMGFAGVLRDLGLPRSEFLTALVTFNVGVEAGQLSVIALALGAVAYWRSNAVGYRRFVVQPASLLIAGIGLFWTIQRAFS
jgi:hydrogenase/urease accessory protein HupE